MKFKLLNSFPKNHEIRNALLMDIGAEWTMDFGDGRENWHPVKHFKTRSYNDLPLRNVDGFKWRVPVQDRKRGRPESNDPRIKGVLLKFSKSEFEQLRVLSKSLKIPLGRWIRETIMKAANPSVS